MDIVDNSVDTRIKKTLSYRYVVYICIALAFFFGYFHRTAASAMSADITAAFNISPTALGLFGSMYFYAYAVGQLPAGILADRWGIRRTISVFVILAGVGCLVLGFSPNFTVALFGRFLIGFGAGFIYVPAVRMITDWFKRSESGTFTGILVAVGNSGSLCSAGPLIAVMALIGWQNAMNAIGIIILVIAVIDYIFIRNKPEDIGGAPVYEMEGRSAPSGNKIGIGESLKIVARNYNFWTITVMFLAMYGTIMSFQGLWAGPYIRNVYGLTPIESGSYLNLIPIGMIIGCPVSGFISDKFRNRKNVMFCGVIGYILVWVPLIFMIDSMSMNIIRVVFFLYGFFGGFFPLFYSNLKENIDVSITGTATGFLNTFVFVFSALFQQLMGIVVNQYKIENNVIPVVAFKTSFIIMFVILCVAAVFYATQKKQKA